MKIAIVASRLRAGGYEIFECDDFVSLTVRRITYRYDGEWTVLVPVSADVGPIMPDEAPRARLVEITST